MPTKNKICFLMKHFLSDLSIKKERDTKICRFQCFDHFQKYMLRYGLNPKDCKIDFAPGTDIDISKISKEQKGKDYKTKKKLFSIWRHFLMEREKLKLIVRNLKLLVESLESEIFSDVDSYLPDKSENFDDEVSGLPMDTSENFDEMYDDWEYDWSDTQLTYRDTNDDDGDGL